MRLFEDVEPFGDRNILPHEPRFDYIQGSGRPEIVVVRNLLESWFSEYPENGQKSKWKMRKRLRGYKHHDYLQRERVFHEAFFELFIYIFLVRLGCQIAVDPEIAGTDLRPDFVATHTGSQQTFYVEATVKKKDYPLRQETILNQIRCILEKVESPNFSVSVRNFRFDAKTQPVLNEADLLSYAERQLSRASQSSLRESPERFHFPGGELSLQFNRLPDSVRGISLFYVPSARSYAQETIRDGVKRKARKYSQLDKPYIVAVNVMEVDSNLQDVFDSLYGPRGEFLSYQTTHASAVWTTTLLSPSNLGSARMVQMENCFAANRFVPDFPCVDAFCFEQDEQGEARLALKKGLKVHQILGLASHWPYDRPRPKLKLWGESER